ncbi:hypothetical protein NEOC65_000548 [Neochlamydia sp. AcF65]|nr:hypothetical protein [Neochlamydia sp. AcF65]MBS4171281.1 hypothetical protein [Neochlamydia sp. AcF95]
MLLPVPILASAGALKNLGNSLKNLGHKRPTGYSL